MNIIVLSSHQTVLYAASELKRLVNAVIKHMSISIVYQKGYDENKKAIYMGLFENFEHLGKKNSVHDEIIIDIQNNKGLIAGSNNISILIAVYELLKQHGYYFPKPDCEIYPTSLQSLNLKIDHRANFKDRGIVIEGANSLQNVLDMLAWLPKVNMNSYFIQFTNPFTFFNLWHSHEENLALSPQPFNKEQSLLYKQICENKMQELNLNYHAVGHAWTCEALGIDGLGWIENKDELSPNIQNMLAMLNNKREFFHGIPINTNICLSNKEAFNRLCNTIVNYAKNNTNIDVLHIWLADEANNSCECEHCTKQMPSDHYIRLLNAVDENLSKLNLKTRIGFIIYLDLLFPPKYEKLNNSDRFLMMFAPITRSFETSYADVKNIGDIPGFVYNKNKMPADLMQNLSFLKAWQKVFNGETLLFDYPLGRAHYGDMGYENISNIIFKDIKTIASLGIDSYLSCQQQRSFLPSSLPNIVMAEMLWDSSQNFDSIADNYYKACFKQFNEPMRDLYKALSQNSSADYFNIKKPIVNEAMADMFKNINELSKKLEMLVNLMQTMAQLPQNIDVKLINPLKYWISMLAIYANSLMYKAQGNNEKAAEYFSKLAEYLSQNELNIQADFDVYRFLKLCKTYLKLQETK